MSFFSVIATLFKKEERASPQPPNTSIATPKEFEERIKKLEKRLSSIENSNKKISLIENRLNSDAEPKLHIGLNLPTAIILLMVIAILAGGLVTITARDAVKFANYLAYIFPMLAGMSAGIGLYIRKPKIGEPENVRRASESVFFQISIWFLLSGLGAFFVSTSILYYAILNLFGFAGTAVAFLSFIKNKENLRSGGTKGDKRFRPVAIIIFAINAIASLAWVSSLVFRL